MSRVTRGEISPANVHAKPNKSKPVMFRVDITLYAEVWLEFLNLCSRFRCSPCDTSIRRYSTLILACKYKTTPTSIENSSQWLMMMASIAVVALDSPRQAGRQAHLLAFDRVSCIINLPWRTLRYPTAGNIFSPIFIAENSTHFVRIAVKFRFTRTLWKWIVITFISSHLIEMAIKFHEPIL